MLSYAETHLSYVTMGTGLVLVILGVILALIIDERRATDLGLFLRGFLFGAGLALLFGGFYVNINVPRAALNMGSQNGLVQPASAEQVNLGDELAHDIQAWGAVIKVRAYYFVPICAILIILLYGLASRKLLRDPKFGLLRGFLIAMLIPLALLAFGNYTGWAQWRYGSYFNAYEFYHYYIGSKYAPEVGYENMYAASLIAAKESGEQYKESEGKIRDLATGNHVSADTVLKDPAKIAAIKARFSEARWQEFVKDIRFFKGKLVGGRWNGILGDKGYNGTPYCSMLIGGLLSNRVDTSNSTGMMCLALLDPLLIGTALLCVCWAFGLAPMLLMIILIGTSYVMSFTHMKGAYLRTDFAMALVIAVCMLKRGHYRSAGGLMMYAALSRVFPAVFFFGAGVKLLQNAALHWRPSIARLFQGMLYALGLTALFTALLYFGLPKDWQAALATKALSILHGRLPEAFLPIAFDLVAALAVAHGLVALWLLRDSPECRPYVRLFSSALLVLTIFSCGVVLDKRIGKVYVDDFSSKIGRHLSDISVWRIGYKYLFINQPALQLERYRALAKDTASAAPAKVDHPEKPAAEAGNEHADEPDTAEAPLPAKPVKTPALRAPDDENGLGRVAISTFRDMRLAAEQAWSKSHTAIVPPTDGKAKTTNAISPGAPAPARSALYEFFKGYVPVARGNLYEEHAHEWWLTMLIVLIVSAIAVLGLKDYEALAFGFVPMFFLVASTYYYFILLAVPLLFFTSALERPTRAIGAALLIATAMPGYYLNSDLGYGQQFATYYWYSVMFFFFSLYMIALGYGDSISTAMRGVKRQPALTDPS